MLVSGLQQKDTACLSMMLNVLSLLRNFLRRQPCLAVAMDVRGLTVTVAVLRLIVVVIILVVTTVITITIIVICHLLAIGIPVITTHHGCYSSSYRSYYVSILVEHGTLGPNNLTHP